MLVKTTLGGVEETIEVAIEQIFAFDPPLGGFPDLRRFVLIPEEESPIEWLQSVDDPAVVFALLEPFLFLPEYSFELAEADVEALELASPSDALVRCVLTLRDDPDEITANLLAPLVFCRRTHLARQVILQDSALPMRYSVFAGVEELARTA
jgi:flagellar assembly factor FliW